MKVALPFISFLFHFREHPEHHDGADDGHDDFAGPTVGFKAKEAEEPAADYAAQQAKKEVDDASAAFALLQPACNVAGQDSCDDSV